MRTIETEAIVTEEGKLPIQVPADIPPGEHHVVVMIDEQPRVTPQRQKITFSAHDVGPWPENLSLRREDMYDEWGR